MSDRHGPRITITADCYGCKFCRSEYFAVQSDTGFTHYCDHPVHSGKYINSYSSTTPDWCPLLEAALAAAKAA